MMLKSIHIENYRSVRDASLDCDGLTALVGANGSGKSSLLRAIDLFFAEKPALTEEDYYDRRTESAIRLTATFGNLSDSAKAQFGDYVANGELAVVRILEWDSRKRSIPCHGIRVQNPDFAPIYGRKKGAKQVYEELLAKDGYADFPKWTNHEEVTACLRRWEADNPDRLEDALDDGGFFTRDRGFPDRFVRLLYVEPVRDAAEDTQERNSALAQLMDVAVRSSLMANENIRKFTEGVQSKYNKLMLSSGQKELNKLGKSMTRTVRQFVPGAEVDLSWRQTELDIGLPAARINLEEDGFPSAVGRAGHGLQRVFIMSMLQHLSEAQAGMEADATELPALLLVIDEPELFQHPNRQRHMSQVLLSLASGGISGASSRTQVVYSTHSPHFVGIDRLDQVRLVRKKAPDGSDEPKTTGISSSSIGAIASYLAAIPKHRRDTGDELARRLQIIMTPVINEGFFADAVMLVEGESDRAALVAVADEMGCSLERGGVSVIPCGGKGNLSGPAAVFAHLDIPLYVVWDADRGKIGERLNSVLLSVMGQPPENPLQPVSDTFACLDNDMGDTIMRDLDGKFPSYRKRVADYLGMDDEDDVLKKPYSVSHLIKTAMREGCRFRTLEDVVQKAMARAEA